MNRIGTAHEQNENKTTLQNTVQNPSFVPNTHYMKHLNAFAHTDVMDSTALYRRELIIMTETTNEQTRDEKNNIIYKQLDVNN